MSYDDVVPFGVLRGLRDGEIATRNDLVSLVTNIDGPCEELVQRLRDEGFVSGEGTTASPYVLDPLVPRLFRALRVSLNELATYEYDSVVCNPIFRVLEQFGPNGPSMLSAASPKRDEQGSLDGFVLMPFASNMRPIYDDHVRAVAERMGLRVARADDFFGTTAIMSDVWQAIRGCKFAIADCTGRNPNVFYELGIAHTLGKPVILLTQDLSDIPFDLRHLRVISYEYTPRGMTALENQLEVTIGVIRGRTNP